MKNLLKNFKIYFFNWYFVMRPRSAPAYFHSPNLKLMFLTSRLLCIFTSLLLVLLGIVVELCTLLCYEVIVLK